jgi:hypothetical protein
MTTPDPTAPAEQPPTTPSDPPAPAADPSADAAPDDTAGLDELPDWARKRLTKANAEAANYRTRLREAEQKLTGAKTVEEFEAAVADVKAANERLESELLRERVARKFDLPDDLAGRLRGATAEELEADATALQKYATPSPPASLSGGLDPSDGDAVFDPVAEARKARSARR